MQEITTKVLIIGGGPAGYVAAIRASQLGLPTIIVDEDRLGGTCLNVGCIPSKAIIHAAEAFHQVCQPASPFGVTTKEAQIDFAKTRDWKDAIVGKLNGGVAFLLRKHKVGVLEGRAEILDGKTCLVGGGAGPTRIRAEHLVIATGSQPLELAPLPFGGPVMSSAGVLALGRVPKSLAVIGAGYIGLELGTAFAKLGAKVTVIEATNSILPAWDRELTQPVAQRLEALGVKVLLGATTQGLRDESVLQVAGKDRNPFDVAAETILVAVGRKPRTKGFGLERLDLDRNGPFIRVDARCATSMRNVWAVGDVTGEPMLAHRAMAQGGLVADVIAGRRRVFDHNAIPAICFTDPEIVAVGLSPDEAHSSGIAAKVGTFPFAANGRALTQADDSGFIRVVTRGEDNVVVGIQAVGAHVSELGSVFSLAIEMGARAEDIAATIAAHPTRGEAFQEAALGVLGHAIHV
jgi:dihydrolipoamide dehydrogenase